MSALNPDQEPLERDTFLNEAFNDLRSRASSITIIKSFIFNYSEENRRTYHNYKDGNPKYYFPNNEVKMERLNL
jgi:hypothetical protein